MAATLEPPQHGHEQYDGGSDHAPRPHGPPKRTFWERITNNRFLFISILVHVVFGLAAAAWVVQSIAAKRKLTFTAAPPSPNPSTRALEHKVQMAKKQNTMSAPVQSKRITTTGIAKVSLPEMPAMPAMSAMTAPGRMAGMGGTGAGLGPSVGAMGSGSGMAGGPVPFFGLRKATGGGSLVGSFYDFKQDPRRKPTGMKPPQFREILKDFVKSGWPVSKLDNYFKAPGKLYTTQFLIPDMSAHEGPKAFDVEKEVEPRMWVAHYEGKVIPPESGTFHFVGNGDDVMYVRFNGKTVLDACWGAKSEMAQKEGRYDYGWPMDERTNRPRPEGALVKGEAIHVEAGRTYPMEVLIGESPGGAAHYVLLIEKNGKTYEKDDKGNPILPVFRLANAKLPTKGDFPKFAPDGPVWKAEQAQAAGPGSGLDFFKKPTPAP